MRQDLPDIYDDRPLRRPPPVRVGRVVILCAVLVLIASGAGFWYLRRPNAKPAQRPAEPVRVVHDRPGGARRLPGATISEAEAVRLLRRKLTDSLVSDCVTTIGAGSDGNAYIFTAFNRCENTRLGRWKVDGKTGVVSRK
jgi:hypothetical protein